MKILFTGDKIQIVQFLRPQRPAWNNCFEQHSFGSLSLNFQTAQLNPDSWSLLDNAPSLALFGGNIQTLICLLKSIVFDRSLAFQDLYY